MEPSLNENFQTPSPLLRDHNTVDMIFNVFMSLLHNTQNVYHLEIKLTGMVVK